MSQIVSLKQLEITLMVSLALLLHDQMMMSMRKSEGFNTCCEISLNSTMKVNSQHPKPDKIVFLHPVIPGKALPDTSWAPLDEISQVVSAQIQNIGIHPAWLERVRGASYQLWGLLSEGLNVLVLFRTTRIMIATASMIRRLEYDHSNGTRKILITSEPNSVIKRARHQLGATFPFAVVRRSPEDIADTARIYRVLEG